MASPPPGSGDTDTGEGRSLAERVAAARQPQGTEPVATDTEPRLTRYQRRSAHLPRGVARFSGDEISVVVDLRGEGDNETKAPPTNRA
jgi:hypothetical protein